MNGLLMLAAAGVPLLLAVFAGLQRGRWLPIIAIMPALAAAWLVPAGSTVELPWLLLGVQLQLDETSRWFLMPSALVWLFAALFMLRREQSHALQPAFRLFFLLAMSGNLLLLLAADMMTFYVGFALMGLAAYPLTLQRSQRGRFGSRIYLVFTLAGELALFAAMLLLFASAGSMRFSDIGAAPLPAPATALLLFGFGIKVALPGLHPWLPMVYSTSPIITAAVLSGPMMKAGLVGWLRFIPAGQDGLVFWGQLLVVLGVIGIALGVGVGLLQREARAVLGYSSIAKMGLISALFGYTLTTPAHAQALVAAIAVFAVHHLLVKSSLFLAVGEWQRYGPQRWVLAILGLLALSLAGAPLSGGAAAKVTLQEALTGHLSWLLAASAIGTALLMVRFMMIITRRSVAGEAVALSALPWLGLLPLAFWGPFLPDALPVTLSGSGLLIIALLLAYVGYWLSARYPALVPGIPPGDYIYLLSRLCKQPRSRPRPATQSGKPVIVEQGVGGAPAATFTLLAPGLILLVLALLLLGTLAISG